MAKRKLDSETASVKATNTDLIDEVLNSTEDQVALFNLINKAGFNYDSAQKIFYSRLDSWQHNVGYCTLYDVAAPLSFMRIHCEPIRFKYAGKSWKIEFWKGRYGICTGAEIGIYTGQFQINPRSATNNHNTSVLKLGGDTQCAGIADWLQMSFVLKRNGNILFTRDSDDISTPGMEKHWWLTGFKPLLFSKLFDLQMDISIVLKDEEMVSSFVDGLVKVGYSRQSAIKIEGLKVSLSFCEPYTKQPWKINTEL